MTESIFPLDLSPLWISLKVASLATVMTFFLGIAAARWMLRYRGRGRSLIENVFVAPLILPPTVVGFLLLLLFGKNGPVGQLMAPWNLSIIFTWYAAVITATVVSFPLMYKTALGAFEQVDPTLLQVAQTLGASEREIFWRVLLPLSLPGLMAGTVLAFARSLGEFGATLMLAGNIPGLTQTMPMAIYFAVEAGAMTEAWFWVLLILAISFTAILLVNGWQRLDQQRSQRRSGRTSSTPLSEQSATASAIAGQNPDRRSPLEGTASDRGLAIALHKPLPHFSLDIAFTAEQGTVGLLGASGSGKSMTLRCIAGVETPTQGQICLNGRILFDAKRGINLPSHHRQVGLVFQNYALFPHMTVAENIGFGLQHLSATARSQRVQQQLALVQLDHFGDRYPHQLSGGQQQRVALARALAIDPDILLLDEPFSALDTHLRSELEKQLIQTLSTYQGLTLFVSHNLEEAYRVCQTLLVLDRGRVLAYDEKQAIFSQPGSVTVAKLTGCKNYSTMHRLSTNSIQAVDWNCTLQTHETVSDRHTHVGIRAHQITFFPETECPNQFSAWVAWTSETPHRITLFLKLGSPPLHADDYHLQAEVFKDRWYQLKSQPMPWTIALEPHKLLLLTTDCIESSEQP